MASSAYNNKAARVTDRRKIVEEHMGKRGRRGRRGKHSKAKEKNCTGEKETRKGKVLDFQNKTRNKWKQDFQEERNREQ